MRYPRNVKIFRGQLDAAPWAGLFFLLLLFFFLRSSLFFTPGVRINLPESDSVSGVTNATETVLIDLNGNLYHDNQLIMLDALQRKLMSAVDASSEPIILVVLADKSSPVEVFTRVGRIARSAGIQEILMATRPPLAPVPAPEPRIERPEP